MDRLAPELKLEILRTCCNHGDSRALLSLSQTSASFFRVYCNNGPRLLRLALESMCISESQSRAIHAILLARLPTRCSSVTETYILEEMEHIQSENFKPSRMTMLRAISRYRMIKRFSITIAKQCNLVNLTNCTYVAAAFILIQWVLIGVYVRNSNFRMSSEPMAWDILSLRLLQDDYDTEPYSEYYLEKPVQIVSIKVNCCTDLNMLGLMILRAFPSLGGGGQQPEAQAQALMRALERDWRSLVRLVVAYWSHDQEFIKRVIVEFLLKEGVELPSSCDTLNHPNRPDGSKSNAPIPDKSRIVWAQKFWTRIRRRQG